MLSTFHYFFPSISPSFSFFELIDPRRACTSFHGKKGPLGLKVPWKKHRAIKAHPGIPRVMKSLSKK
jgi:hypothetical protein